MEQEDGEHGARPGTAELGRRPVSERLEWAEDAELRAHSLDRNSGSALE